MYSRNYIYSEDLLASLTNNKYECSYSNVTVVMVDYLSHRMVVQYPDKHLELLTDVKCIDADKQMYSCVLSTGRTARMKVDNSVRNIS